MIKGFSSYAAALQPFPAYLGLISCLTIVFIFNSAGMWNGNELLLKGLNVYLAVRNPHSLTPKCIVLTLSSLASNLPYPIHYPQDR